MPNNVGNLGKIIVATGFNSCQKYKKSPKMVTQVNRYDSQPILKS